MPQRTLLATNVLHQTTKPVRAKLSCTRKHRHSVTPATSTVHPHTQTHNTLQTSAAAAAMVAIAIYRVYPSVKWKCSKIDYQYGMSYTTQFIISLRL